MPHPYQTYFQNPGNGLTFNIYIFHDFIFVVVCIVLTVVLFSLISILTNTFTNRNLTEAHTLETIWTILPAVTLSLLVFPSIRLLYIREELPSVTNTVKTTGHQWYWTYRWPEEYYQTFDSFIVQARDLTLGDHRLLECDNRLVLPHKSHIRILVTSADVIHSWTIPALCLKVDAIPGRLNQLNIIPTQHGIYYGQCSEICGANHSFIPIAIEIANKPYFNYNIYFNTYKYKC